MAYTPFKQVFDVCALEVYLLSSAALVPYLNVTITQLTASSLTLAAPLAPNINHKGMAFGGSLHAIATLACWGLLSSYLGEYRQDTGGVSIVVSRSEVDYLLPVTNDFTITATLDDLSQWQRFMTSLKQHSKARLVLTAELLLAGGESALNYRGEFAAKRISRLGA